MSASRIRDLLEGKVPTNSSIVVKGWVRTRRDSKAGFSFLHVTDGSCFKPIQAVVDADIANYESEILHLTTGCAVEVEGTLVESRGKGQAVEVQASKVTLVGDIEDPDTYPIQPKEHTFEYLREVAHLRPRTNTFGAMTRVRHAVAQAIHRYFHENGFYWINTPIITASDAEGAGEMFRVSTLSPANPPRTDDNQVDYAQDFFARETFLTVSGQLNVEGFCLANSRVYTFGPTFRAENSNTSRHLAEFWMVEPEIAFADLDDLADLAEEFLGYVFAAVLEECADDMAFFQQQVDSKVIKRLEQFVDNQFARMEYSEAIDLLKKVEKKFDFPVEWGLDLQTEHERFLSEQYARRPVVVMNYPKEIKAFYMRLNDDGRSVAAMDVLAPGIGEIIGGSQREERYDVLEQRMAHHGMDVDQYSWYLDLRRYGTVPHAGFGLGFERLVSYITGMSNIRDVIPYPRVPGNADF
ncbi:MAG: asparagine--tRNA ligase [Xanthomonadales bacterium]|nr:asparagine--tRNA ligase [Xanthomonadales bacterium]